MKKELFYENRAKLLLALISVLTLLFLTAGYHTYIAVKTRQNDRSATAALDMIHYEYDAAQSEMALLAPYTEEEHLSPSMGT